MNCPSKSLKSGSGTLAGHVKRQPLCSKRHKRGGKVVTLVTYDRYGVRLKCTAGPQKTRASLDFNASRHHPPDAYINHVRLTLLYSVSIIAFILSMSMAATQKNMKPSLMPNTKDLPLEDHQTSSESYAFLVHSQDTLNHNLPPTVDNPPLARQKRRRTR